MFYRPDYCCNCGERIERIEWKITSSRKFCELCETEFKFEEILPRAIFIILMVFGVWGFGSLFFERGERVIVAPPKNLKSLSRNSNRSLSNTFEKKTRGDSEKDLTNEKEVFPNKNQQTTGKESASHKKLLLNEQRQKGKSPKNGQKKINNSVYFCGAETKKGNPCSRKVKGGGRCWQHRGLEKISSKSDPNVETP